jgi:hypothetical protein
MYTLYNRFVYKLSGARYGNNFPLSPSDAKEKAMLPAWKKKLQTAKLVSGRFYLNAQIIFIDENSEKVKKRSLIAEPLPRV